MPNNDDDLLVLRDLSVEYATAQGPLKALRNVSITVPKKRIVGVVGESGCGKSTLISSIIRLMSPNAVTTSGKIAFQGRDLLALTETQMRALRGTEMSIVFQDPMMAHNPVLTIGRQMMDVQYRDRKSAAQRRDTAIEMLAAVGIPDPRARLAQYPHEFSGGMRQRIAIAMALMAKPALLIADEPTTALDATLEVQIIETLKALQSDIGCSVLFISHHLGVIAELCEDVVVMYAGEVVERGSVRDVFHRPAHPYTERLLECDPGRIKERARVLPTIPGEIPDLASLPSGCIFADRCSSRMERCSVERPALDERSSGHFAACHLTDPHLSTSGENAQ